MKIIKGIAILTAFLALGEVISVLIGNFLPGSVIGLLRLSLNRKETHHTRASTMNFNNHG